MCKILNILSLNPVTIYFGLLASFAHSLYIPLIFCTWDVHLLYNSLSYLLRECLSFLSPLPLRIIPLFWGSPYFTQHVRVAQIVQGIPPLPWLLWEARDSYPLTLLSTLMVPASFLSCPLPFENSSTFSLFSIPSSESFGGDRNVPGRESRREITHSPTIVLLTLQPMGNSLNSSP